MSDIERRDAQGEDERALRALESRIDLWRKKYLPRLDGPNDREDLLYIIAMDAIEALRSRLATPGEDARELVRKARAWTPDTNWPAVGAEVFYFDSHINDVAALIERFAAERERKAREEEREDCAGRAEAFYRRDCGGCGELCDKAAKKCDHLKGLRAAIKEAGNGN